MPDQDRPSPRRELSVTSVLTLAFFCAGAGVAYAANTLIPSEFGQFYFFNHWFEGDIPRVVSVLTDRRTLFSRAEVHPIFTVTLAPFTLALTRLFGLPSWQAVSLVSAAGAGLLAALFFLVARQVSGRTADACVATVALLTSAAFLFWTAVPETFVWSAASILAVLFVVGLPGRRPPALLFIVASAASLGYTIANWPVGLFAAAVSYRRRRAVALTLFAFTLVAGLVAVSVNVFPFAGRFLRVASETEFLNRDPRTWPRIPPVFLVSAIVAPEPTLIAEGDVPDHVENKLSMQRTDWRAQSPLMLGAAALWLGALGIGGWALWRRLRDRPAGRLAPTLAFAIAFQFGLFLIYGSETFVYALNFAPLLLLAALTGTTTRMRPVSLALLAAVTLFGGVNNWRQFTAAAAESRTLAATSERGRVHAARELRPGDYWPRSAGHVPLGFPGVPERMRAYAEPGGPFSPSVGSFGVSVWTRNTVGYVLHSRGVLGLELTRSRFLTDAIGIESTTPYSVIRWESPQPGTWRMTLTSNPIAERLSVVIRSVGPAGGPIRTILNEGGRLTINGRWQITLGAGLSVERIGVESRGWIGPGAADAPERAQDPQGWLYAMLHVDGPSELVVVDPQAAPVETTFASLGPRGLRSGLDLDLPEARFAQSLDAQVGQILQGIAFRAAPGEPLDDPRIRQRDGAFIATALVRAGRADASRELAALTPPAPETEMRRLPVNTALAQARRSLASGDAVRAWATLEEFWVDTPHPGLFTLWESIVDEKERTGWENVRGWVRATQVTPHYRASAEMILLQTAMLAEIDRTATNETLVIGAGVKPEWPRAPMSARGLVTDWGRVDWSWDGRAMHVVTERAGPVRLGAAFPAGAPIIVQRSPAE